MSLFVCCKPYAIPTKRLKNTWMFFKDLHVYLFHFFVRCQATFWKRMEDFHTKQWNRIQNNCYKREQELNTDQDYVMLFKEFQLSSEKDMKMGWGGVGKRSYIQQIVGYSLGTWKRDDLKNINSLYYFLLKPIWWILTSSCWDTSRK